MENKFTGIVLSRGDGGNEGRGDGGSGSVGDDGTMEDRQSGVLGYRKVLL